MLLFYETEKKKNKTSETFIQFSHFSVQILTLHYPFILFLFDHKEVLLNEKK